MKTRAPWRSSSRGKMMTATSRCPTSRIYMYMGKLLFVATSSPFADQTVLFNRHPMRVESVSSAPSQHPPSRRNHPVHLHPKMASANDAPAVLVARKTGVSAVPLPKEMYQPRAPQLRSTLPPHMDFTNTLLPQRRGKSIRTINNIMNFNGVF